ncbi:hypothetical protein F0562_019940 [Nyssa sinensis]|uniref:Uncharacterized protein n=1 Tax=Nyssa sinensis TaxID=561372 RepID=A0A5J5BV71_9ASTE|nr:hypothetical protein F0562_019940 [Nyssa sinensis]
MEPFFGEKLAKQLLVVCERHRGLDWCSDGGAYGYSQHISPTMVRHAPDEIERLSSYSSSAIVHSLSSWHGKKEV